MTGFCNGILTAMITPFTQNGVNLEEFGKMIEYQIEGGTDALVVLGTTGEPATMTEAEKEEAITYAVKKAAGRIKIIVGTGSNNTAKAVAASVKAEKLGADGVLAVTPYYNKCTQKGLLEYYRAICAAVKIPVIAYNVPSRTAVNILPETAEKLAQSGVTDLLLSVDAFHQETIPLEPVKIFAGAVRETGIPIRTQPAWLVDSNDPNPYNQRTYEILREFDLMGIASAKGNIIYPEGNARRYLSEYFDSNKDYMNPYAEDSLDIRSICVAPDGDVLGGNIYERDILDILDGYVPPT